jgi:hypothetical protein
MTALDPEHPNPIEDQSDRELVRNADAYSEIEMSRRLKDSISEQTASLLASQKTTNDLTTTIKRLTIVLVVLESPNDAAPTDDLCELWAALQR